MRQSSAELRRVKVEVMWVEGKARLGWYVLIEWQDETDWARHCTQLVEERTVPVSRPRKIWQDSVSADSGLMDINPWDARDHACWRKAIRTGERSRAWKHRHQTTMMRLVSDKPLMLWFSKCYSILFYNVSSHKTIVQMQMSKPEEIMWPVRTRNKPPNGSVMVLVSAATWFFQCCPLMHR